MEALSRRALGIDVLCREFYIWKLCVLEFYIWKLCVR